MKVERREEEVWITRNKRRGLRLKKKDPIMKGACEGCCLKMSNPKDYLCLSYQRLLIDICNREKIVFGRVYEGSKRRR